MKSLKVNFFESVCLSNYWLDSINNCCLCIDNVNLSVNIHIFVSMSRKQ